jgi:hypothetical protein
MTGQHDAGGQNGRDRDQAGRSGRPRQAPPGPDIIGDIQRWFIRSSAKNMRNQVGDQVRKTFGGSGPRVDVWDAATTEPPPQEGEAPECQWCPVCRAARRMREAGPGLGDQLSGAGDAVAAAVQEAFKAFDGLLGRAAGNGAQAGGAAGGGAAGGGGVDAGRAGAGRAGAGGADAGRADARPAGAEAAGGESAGAESAGAESAGTESAGTESGRTDSGRAESAGPESAGPGRADVWRDAAQPGGPEDRPGNEPGDRG